MNSSDITAHDWVTRSTIDRTVLDRWPDYRAILIAADHAATAALGVIAERLHADAHEAARSLDPGEPDKHTARWHDAYRDFGIKPRVARPSVDALVRRAASEKGLPRINVLVDLYNAISILHGVPIGGEDLDRYRGPARLILASGDESFNTSAGGEATIEHPSPDEPVWIDDEGVTCRRWNWRQTTRTAIRPDTVRVGFIIDSLDAPHHHTGATLAAEQLAELFTRPHIRTIDTITN
jgi:DNA/RNA-binding domain of Phe-tRNA-synthetase-like protein